MFTSGSILAIISALVPLAIVGVRAWMKTMDVKGVRNEIELDQLRKEKDLRQKADQAERDILDDIASGDLRAPDRFRRD